MNCKIIPLPNFRREAKRLLKKYPSLQKELGDLIALLTQQPRTGIMITENFYKIRLAVKSKGKGKSGGLRVITCVMEMKQEEESSFNIFLASIYDKSDIQTIKDSDIRTFIETINESLNDEE